MLKRNVIEVWLQSAIMADNHERVLQLFEEYLELLIAGDNKFED